MTSTSSRALTIVRGAREVDLARGKRNRSSKSSKQSMHRSRVPGQVGVAVRREYVSRNTFSTLDNGYDEDAEYNHEHRASREEMTGAGTSISQQAAHSFKPGCHEKQPSAMAHDADYSTRAVEDLTADGPEDQPRVVPAKISASLFVAPSQSLRNSSAGACADGQLPDSWLLPAASSTTPPQRTKSGRRRQRPKQSTGESSDDFPPGTSAWGVFSQGQKSRQTGGGHGGSPGRVGGSLSSWLEPRKPANSRQVRLTDSDRGGDAMSYTHADRYGSDDGRADEEYNGDGDHDGHGNGNDSWMSDRLEGLDPNGEARAKIGWTDRERRNLTCTDVALGTKRKGRGGWRTKAGSKVFVAPRRGGTVVAAGQAAFRMSKGSSGTKKKRKV